MTSCSRSICWKVELIYNQICFSNLTYQKWNINIQIQNRNVCFETQIWILKKSMSLTLYVHVKCNPRGEEHKNKDNTNEKHHTPPGWIHYVSHSGVHNHIFTIHWMLVSSHGNIKQWTSVCVRTRDQTSLLSQQFRRSTVK